MINNEINIKDGTRAVIQPHGGHNFPVGKNENKRHRVTMETPVTKTVLNPIPINCAVGYSLAKSNFFIHIWKKTSCNFYVFLLILRNVCGVVVSKNRFDD